MGENIKIGPESSESRTKAPRLSGFTGALCNLRMRYTSLMLSQDANGSVGLIRTTSTNRKLITTAAAITLINECD